MKEWHNAFPISTFAGETKKELIVLIESLLEKEREMHEDEMVKFRKAEIEDLERARKEEKEKWQLKNAGLYRQLFGEMRSDRYFTARALWEYMNDYAPLFTPEQLEDIKKQLK